MAGGNAELFRLSATEALAELSSGGLTVERLAQACLDHIADREPLVRAWIHVDPTRLIEEARRLDALPLSERGPLHGVPVGIKDVLLTRDMPTGYGSMLYDAFAPTVDAAAVAVLRAAGALLVGKTETVEFAAIGRKPPTRNPANPAHTPGGSSSGSAAAVADFHVPLALGTQTGGSIIRPASFCGTWALKPSWGLVDRDGSKSFAPSLDTIGWFGRTADDLALLLGIFDPAPAPRSVPEVGGLRIALCRTPMWDEAETPMVAAFETAGDRLRAAGATVAELELPQPFDQLARLHKIVMLGEGRATFLADYRRHGPALADVFRDMVDHGPSRAELIEAYDVAVPCRAEFDRIAAPYDAVLAPSAVGTAPEGLSDSGALTFNGMWTLLHTPCVNVPAFIAANGLPVGLTVTGPRFSDWRVVAAAAAIGMLLADPFRPLSLP